MAENSELKLTIGLEIHAELKTETGRLTAAQERFRDAILAARGTWYLWRPSDWPTIVNTLRGCD